MQTNRKPETKNQILIHLPFSEKVECFEYLFLCCSLVDADVSNAAHEGEIDQSCVMSSSSAG